MLAVMKILQKTINAVPEVDAAVLHMCANGMKSSDEHGEGLVKKPTRIMSSSPEVLARVAIGCSNEQGGPQLRHVHLVQGRARAAQVYPKALCVKICEGIAAQKRLICLDCDRGRSCRWNR